MGELNSVALTYVIPQSRYFITTKFGVGAVVGPPARREIKLRACITTYTSRISNISPPIPISLLLSAAK